MAAPAEVIGSTGAPRVTGAAGRQMARPVRSVGYKTNTRLLTGQPIAYRSAVRCRELLQNNELKVVRHREYADLYNAEPQRCRIRGQTFLLWGRPLHTVSARHHAPPIASRDPADTNATESLGAPPTTRGTACMAASSCSDFKTNAFC